MKKLMFFTFLISVSQAIYAQTEIKMIDVSSGVIKDEVTIKTGNYSFFMAHFDTSKQYEISAIKKNVEISKLLTPEEFVATKSFVDAKEPRQIGNFDFSKGEKLTITINVFDIGKDAKDNRTKTKIETYTYVYKTEPRGEWRTTFGFNFVYLTNQDNYFSKSNTDGTFTITEGSNRKKFEYYPTLMFTWLPNNFMDDNKNWQIGFSGGIGYDFNTSLSVFLAPSIIYNENITISIGGAFHNQERLLSKYNKDQIVNEELDFGQLHDDYIRFNPFVSISFRLDRNPFTK